jgi:hypothetical protein
MCYVLAAYFSALGLAGVVRSFDPSKVQLVLLGMILVNLVSVWFRSRITGGRVGFYTACIATLVIVFAKTETRLQSMSSYKVALMLLAALWTSFDASPLQSHLRRFWLQRFK